MNFEANDGCADCKHLGFFQCCNQVGLLTSAQLLTEYIIMLILVVWKQQMTKPASKKVYKSTKDRTGISHFEIFNAYIFQLLAISSTLGYAIATGGTSKYN